MAALVDVESFRIWSGANLPTNVSDELISMSLDEAEAGLLADVGCTLDDLVVDAAAIAVARGDEMRRASRYLARRNSPEGVAGAGSEGIISIPSRDPDTQRSIWTIQAILGVPMGVV